MRMTKSQKQDTDGEKKNPSVTLCEFSCVEGVTQHQSCRYSGSVSSQLTLLILLLLSAVRNDMLLISLITTKFCSSRLKFCNSEGWEGEK